jgi:hypothetical protein
MADNKSKRKADKRRVALKQTHEREYLLRNLRDAVGHLVASAEQIGAAAHGYERALMRIRDAMTRLRAGFPRKADLRLKRGRRG